MSDTDDDPTLVPPTAPPVEGPPTATGEPSPPGAPLDASSGPVWEGGDVAPEPAPANSSARTWIIAGAASVVIAIVSFVGINLVTGHKDSAATTAAAGTTTGGATDQNGATRTFGRGTAGTISAIDGSMITLTSDSGTSTKVATSDSTTVSSSATASLADIVVGDHVSVMGTVSGTDVTAERITDSGATEETGPGGGPAGQGPPTDQTFTPGQPPTDGSGAAPAGGFAGSGQAPPGGAAGGPGGGQFGRGVRGQVTSINGSTLVITNTDGTTSTVTASSTTTVVKVSAGSVADLKVGEQIQVIGATGSDGTVTADRIVEGDAGAMAFRGGPPPGSATTPTTT